MGLLESIPIIGKLFSDTTEIVKEAVTDKDAQNKILENLEMAKQQIEKEIYLKELETKTVPWVDAIHKLGRQAINVLTLIITALLLAYGKDITGPAAMLLGGGNLAYQIIKGKGQ